MAIGGSIGKTDLHGIISLTITCLKFESSAVQPDAVHVLGACPHWSYSISLGAFDCKGVDLNEMSFLLGFRDYNRCRRVFSVFGSNPRSIAIICKRFHGTEEKQLYKQACCRLLLRIIRKDLQKMIKIKRLLGILVVKWYTVKPAEWGWNDIFAATLHTIIEAIEPRWWAKLSSEEPSHLLVSTWVNPIFSLEYCCVGLLLPGFQEGQ